MLSATAIVRYYELLWRTSELPTRGRAKSQLSTRRVSGNNIA